MTPIVNPPAALPTCRVDLADQHQPALQQEWLLTNGLGGFAMGTASGCNTRRYHGLLIATRRPPVDRFNTVNLVGEQLVIDDQAHELFTMQFAGTDGPVFHPNGWRYLQRFEKDTTCRWVYHVGPVRLIKQLRLIWKRQIALLSYRLDLRPDADQPAPQQISLRLMPLVSLRDFHSERNDAHPDLFKLSVDHKTVTLTGWDLPRVQMASDVGEFHPHEDLWRNVYYQIEADRQLAAVEQLYSPGCFDHAIDTQSLADGQAANVRLMIAAEPIDWSVADEPDQRSALLEEQIDRVTEQAGEAELTNTLATLVAAANDFVVDREVDGKKLATILAGYPWFSDWGRDTFISLPGLLLCTGRYTDAKRTLNAYARYIRNGLIPNRFDDYGGDPHYNTVDASLWFVHAALEYLKITGDNKTWKKTLESACLAILTGYRDGEPPLIGMDDDGLIRAGDQTSQLTWMDAKCNGVTFTPRHGKVVEINALWHHGLVGFNKATKNKYKDLAELAPRVAKSFDKTFWNKDLGYLVDHVNEHGTDHSFRPNQVLAVSLEHSPLSSKKQQSIMQHVTDKLLTPVGLRTLPVDDPNYHGQCVGSMFERDRAYHQGTVWPWLIGPYVEGLLRSRKFSKPARRQAAGAIAPMLHEVVAHSLGQLHEVYDGDAPHAARGCIAQAWSIAELLRAVILIDSD